MASLESSKLDIKKHPTYRMFCKIIQKQKLNLEYRCCILSIELNSTCFAFNQILIQRLSQEKQWFTFLETLATWQCLSVGENHARADYNNEDAPTTKQAKKTPRVSKRAVEKYLCGFAFLYCQLHNFNPSFAAVYVTIQIIYTFCFLTTSRKARSESNCDIIRFFNCFS